MKIAVIGGDERMSTVARLFRKSGFDCITAATGNQANNVFEAIKDSAVTVLPLPCQKGGKLNAPTSNEEIYVDDIFAAGSGKTLFIGGMLPSDLPQSEDISLREDFLLKNAVLTAEGAEYALADWQEKFKRDLGTKIINPNFADIENDDFTVTNREIFEKIGFEPIVGFPATE